MFQNNSRLIYGLMSLIIIAINPIQCRFLKIVDQYENMLAGLSARKKQSMMGDHLQYHIDVLKRIHILHRVDEASSPDEFSDEMCSSFKVNATPCQEPLALFLGGGTASGKSSITKVWYPVFENSPCGYVHIDPDAIMMEMPEWDILINGSRAECAASDLHTNASVVALSCYKHCLSKNLSLVFDGTMASYGQTVAMIEEAASRDYQVQMYGVTVETSVAADRAMSRAKVSKRYVPLCVILATHTGYSQYFTNYTNIIPNNRLYYTDQSPPMLIFANETILNDALYEEFLEKADETLDEVEKEMNASYITDYDQLNQECQTCLPLGGAEKTKMATEMIAFLSMLYFLPLNVIT